MSLEEIFFEGSEALRVPVLIAALLAFAIILAEFGALIAELWRRRRRSLFRLQRTVDVALDALATGDGAGALASLQASAFSRPMSDTLQAIVELRDVPRGQDRINKAMAELDYRNLRRLERTRMLVRFGPALGLMGTLIPLSPALGGLARGDVDTLTENLRVAFGVTVAGLLIGAFAFAVSLVRDRLYAQDFSDVEYVMVSLAHDDAQPPPPPPPPSAAAV
jgi:biopolymer transport protein ExbB/TolQ